MRPRILVPLVAAVLKLTHAESIPYTDEITHGAISVGVGDPPTLYKLMVDTGSANTWVGREEPFKTTPTTRETGDTVKIYYSSGSFSGKELIDQVTLSPNLVVSDQSIGVSTEKTSVEDGILGLGPTSLTNGTLQNNIAKQIPTVLDNLYSEAKISSHVFSIDHEFITFGGYDASKVIGDVVYTPITTTFPASNFWGIDASFMYGGEVILALTAGIVDHGTAMLLLAADAFEKFQKATGAVMDSDTDLLTITPEQYSNLKSLYINLGDHPLEIPSSALLWPRDQNDDIGGDPNKIYLIVGDQKALSGQGMDFLIGYRILRKFYTVFDVEKDQVGFAYTSFTNTTEN
ncbi:hypothetical protein BGW38_004400 [Lunasporangiospora selenospora]|uniref:Peptidase A1 domain-containing protein n=1 Tax=Lunasporangiospora selenospora TaxID=979761 RepID=A0A9P6KC71_9FUNG|nr:hypothetical protein BGW38_004400 [Lunasporangiospora selenospora]